MISSRVLFSPLRLNSGSKIAVTTFTIQRLVYNLKGKNFVSVINNVHRKNCKTNTTDNSSENIFFIASYDSPINLHNSRESIFRNATNERKSPKVTRLNSHSFVQSRTSNLLTMTQNYSGKLSTRSLGIRHLSTEATRPIEPPVLTGFWKDISESAPVEFFQDSLISFQSSTGLPWWATVVLSTLIVRSTLTLPLSLYQVNIAVFHRNIRRLNRTFFFQHYILAKVQNLSGEMNEIVKQLKTEANYAVSRHGWSESYTRNVYDQSVTNYVSEIDIISPQLEKNESIWFL